MSGAVIRTNIRQRQPFIVELWSGQRSFNKHDVESLIEACPSSPDTFSVFRSGFLAGKLFFRQWTDALACVLFFWERRLGGAHLLNPNVVSKFFVPSDQGELFDGLKSLFVAHVQQLLDGEAVGRCRKKIDAVSKEIKRFSGLLQGRNGLIVYKELREKKDRFFWEREQITKRLEEFRASLRCIISWIEGRKQENCREDDDDVKVFRFGGDLDWCRIHQLLIRECRRLDEGLPIYGSRCKILGQIRCQQAMVLIGETGSGKSTQLVQFLADSAPATDGSIICTQPRKIAAMSLARRVGEESNGCYEDSSVIYCPAYSSTQSFRSKVLFMTDHCLLQHCMSDMNLASISYIIVDEAHERSLNTDLLLALVKKLLLQRLDLRLIIMSATADARKLSDYFFGCATFHVSGRNFPVDIKYVPNVSAETTWTAISKPNPGNCASYVSDVVKMVTEIHKTEEDGAILAFLTSQIEVEWACENFQTSSEVVALAMHGKLSCEEQNRVFQSYPEKRKVIFATNLAETSLTIPGVKFVVDSGMVKESRFEPDTGMNVLRVCRISQSSANQRAGRAGRTEPGKCYRLYSEHDLELMPCHQEPEIRRVHLGIAVLRIIALGIQNVEEFDFVDTPCPEAIDMATRNLIQLGAIICKNDVFEFTDNGRYMVRMGIEPRLGKLILDSFHYGLGREGLVLAAVMANSSNIFCRVGNDEDKSKSDCLKVQFCHRYGDLFTLLSVYKEWDDLPFETRNKWCWVNSINAKTMRRCKETVLELERCLQNELNIIIPSYWQWKPHIPSACDKLLKKVILSSLAENVAMFSGYNRLGYEVALTGQHVQLHPSCSLLIYGQKPSWVVFGELLSLSSQYLICVTAFDYECLHMLRPPPLFNVSLLKSQKMQMKVLTGFGSSLLRRFCGKANSSLHCLLSRIQTVCMGNHVGIDVDFDKREIQLFALPDDMNKVSGLVNDALEYETKWLRDECIEKCLFRVRRGFSPSVALLGAGAEIMHLELEKRYLTVEIFHSKAHTLDDKELLMIIDRCASGIANFHKCAGVGQGREDLEKWGKLTYLSPGAAERAVVELNKVEFDGSLLKVVPLQTSIGSDHKILPFPAVNARICWPRRHSKGVAIVRCAKYDADFIVRHFSTILIGGRFVRCEFSRKYPDCVMVCGLDKDISEPEILDALRHTTKKRIEDVFLLRGEAVNTPPGFACAEALRREIAPFMPSKNFVNNNCEVQVFPSDPKDYMVKASITFDGSLHLEAAMALDHIEGKVLTGCLPWQRIQCHKMFHSSVSCPAPVYFVIKRELDALIERFNQRNGVFCNLEKNDNGSYRMKLAANATKTVADLRKPLEQLMNGTIITHPDFTSSVQLLLTREGSSLMKSLQKETGTYILYDRHNLNVKVFGPPEEVAVAEQRLVKSLLSLHENKQLEIRLRGGVFPQDLMKKMIQKFGPNLHGLKDMVPGADFVLNTRRHILSVRGSMELKRNVEEIISAMVDQSLNNDSIPFELPNGEPTCPICLCEIDDQYRVEACQHAFCRSCLIDQIESAIKSREGFPLCCTHEGCNQPIFLVDLRSLVSSDKLEELFRASLGAYVAASSGTYRFCPSPDCPAIYRVSGPEMEGGHFACGACSVETCTKCHLEYHPFVSCEKYKEFKEDPDSSLKEWRKGKQHVKNCPVCEYTIEKVEGCNHIECKCGKHICWVCLESFLTSDDCYGHLRTVHLNIYEP